MAGESSGAKGFAFFGINVDLTEDGIEHVDHIVTLAFQVRSFIGFVFVISFLNLISFFTLF
jgi:hypothetical protein